MPNDDTGGKSIQKSASLIEQGNESDDKVIDAVMEKLANSFKVGDYASAMDVMYVPILESLGGREKAVEGAKALMAQMKEQGMVIIYWKTRKPYTYLAGDSHKYAVIPYEMGARISGKKMKQTSYQLGIKTANSGWQFVNGDQLTPEIIGHFFPDFPKDFELPEMQQSWE